MVYARECGDVLQSVFLCVVHGVVCCDYEIITVSKTVILLLDRKYYIFRNLPKMLSKTLNVEMV